MPLTYVAKMKLQMVLPEQIIMLSDMFSVYDKKLYVVGGAVRDSVYSKLMDTYVAIKDYDLCTDALPNEIMQILKDADIHFIDIGAKYGVITAIIDGDKYEIATFRTDKPSSDGRRPDGVVFSTVEEDAKRRDFYINALYYDIVKEEVLDFNNGNGFRDLQDGRVNFIGNIKDRIEEDKLRVFRYARFTATYPNAFAAFSTIDDIRNIIKKVDFSSISKERITDEFLKGLEKTRLDKEKLRLYLIILKDLNLLKFIFCGVTLAYLENSGICVLSSEFIVFRHLYCQPYDSIKKILTEMKYSSAFIKKVLMYHNIYYMYDCTKVIEDVNSIADDELMHIAKLSVSGKTVEQYFNLRKLRPTTSTEAIALGKTGKEIGEYMKRQDLLKIAHTLDIKVGGRK